MWSLPLDAKKGSNVVSLRPADRGARQTGYQADQAQAKRASAARQRVGQAAGAAQHLGQAPPASTAGPLAFAQIIDILDGNG